MELPMNLGAQVEGQCAKHWGVRRTMRKTLGCQKDNAKNIGVSEQLVRRDTSGNQEE